jgi:hypothetical protein
MVITLVIEVGKAAGCKVFVHTIDFILVEAFRSVAGAAAASASSTSRLRIVGGVSEVTVVTAVVSASVGLWVAVATAGSVSTVSLVASVSGSFT